MRILANENVFEPIIEYSEVSGPRGRFGRGRSVMKAVLALYVAVLGLLLAGGCSKVKKAHDGSPPRTPSAGDTGSAKTPGIVRGEAAVQSGQAVASSQEVKVRFAGRVERIEPLGGRALKVIPVHFDPNFALAVRVESVDQQKTPIQVGCETVFAIHSPTKLFAEDAEEVVGRTFRFRVTWHTGPPERFSGLSVVRDAGTPVPASSVRFLMVPPDEEKRSGLYAIKTPPPKRPMSWPWEFRRAADGIGAPPRAGLPVTLVGKLPGQVIHFDYFEPQEGSISRSNIDIPARFVGYAGPTDKVVRKDVYVVVNLPPLKAGRYRARITLEDFRYEDLRDRTKIERVPPGRPPRFAPLTCEFEVRAAEAAAAVTLWQWGEHPSKVDPDNKRPALVQVRGLTGIAAVAAGRHYLALKTDGTVWATNGRSGASIRPRDPSLPGVGMKGLVPGLVAGLKDVTAVATTCDHSLALQADGTVRAWGWNHFGQLGDGTTRTWYPPSPTVRVRGLSGVTAIAAGSGHSLALRKDGTVWAWGRNVDGELGDGTNVDRHLPVQVRGLDRVTAIAAGGERSLALRADGTVWAWGNNFLGQVGDGTRTFRNSPVRVVGLEKIAAISAGRAHSLALGNEGTVWVWGGHGSRKTEVGVPAPVSELTGAVAVAGGDLHSLALKPDGTVWAWGGNMYGELGGGSDKWHDVPVQVKGLAGVKAIAAGDHYSLALRVQDAKNVTTDVAPGAAKGEAGPPAASRKGGQEPRVQGAPARADASCTGDDPQSGPSIPPRAGGPEARKTFLESREPVR